MKKLTQILRELREDLDLKQSDIAEKLGTTQQYYSKYETGKYELPLRSLVILADFYGVSVDYLLGRTECRDGVDGMNKTVIAGYTSGKMVSDVLSLIPKAAALLSKRLSFSILRKKPRKYKKNRPAKNKRGSISVSMD